MEIPNGARLTHEEVALGGAHHTINERHTPTIYRAASPHELATMELFPPPENARRIVLARSQQAPQAYILTRSPEDAINLYHAGVNRPQNWGNIYFAELCPLIGNTGNVFQVPQLPQERQEVVIKVLNKAALAAYSLIHPNGENPLKEIARMQEIGDDVHVLKLIEALEDQKYLYIVMPKGVETLDKYVQRFKREGREMHPVTCHQIFCKIIQICAYLMHHRINHHDLSPDNLMFLTENNLVLIDFALSNRIPIDPSLGHRALIAPPRVGGYVYGKPAWMDAVVYGGRQAYDGVAMDLYAAGLILYYMTTSNVLYERPSRHHEPFYNHFIHLGGLWRSNQQTIDSLQEIIMTARDNQDYSILFRLRDLSRSHMNISPQVLTLLMNMLNENPAGRFTLANVMESDYVNHFQG